MADKFIVYGRGIQGWQTAGSESDEIVKCGKTLGAKA
jgi:hypothetical protein